MGIRKKEGSNLLIIIMVLPVVLMIFIFCYSCSAVNVGSGGNLPVNTNMIIDHTCINLNHIPVQAVINAKAALHIAYSHASHGNQLIEGTKKLDAFMSGKPTGATPAGTYAVNYNGTPAAGELDFFNLPWWYREHPATGWIEYGRDLGSSTTNDDATIIDPDYTAWVYTTRRYLGWKWGSGDGTHMADYATGTPDYNPSACHNCNVIMWSWCGQAGYPNNRTNSGFHHIENYLANMSQLEIDYPQVKFVYMTGAADGTGLSGDLHQNNNIIREYCRTYNKILYDFEDIESYDPDGIYYGDHHITAACNWDANGNGTTEQIADSGPPPTPLNGDRNWALDWQGSHTLGTDWYQSSITNYHTQHLNHNLKAYACWWLFARLAGWDGK